MFKSEQCLYGVHQSSIWAFASSPWASDHDSEVVRGFQAGRGGRLLPGPARSAGLLPTLPLSAQARAVPQRSHRRSLRVAAWGSQGSYLTVPRAPGAADPPLRAPPAQLQMRCCGGRENPCMAEEGLGPPGPPAAPTTTTGCGWEWEGRRRGKISGRGRGPGRPLARKHVPPWAASLSVRSACPWEPLARSRLLQLGQRGRVTAAAV